MKCLSTKRFMVISQSEKDLIDQIIRIYPSNKSSNCDEEAAIQQAFEVSRKGYCHLLQEKIVLNHEHNLRKELNRVLKDSLGTISNNNGKKPKLDLRRILETGLGIPKPFGPSSVQSQYWDQVKERMEMFGGVRPPILCQTQNCLAGAIVAEILGKCVLVMEKTAPSFIPSGKQKPKKNRYQHTFCALPKDDELRFFDASLYNPKSIQGRNPLDLDPEEYVPKGTLQPGRIITRQFVGMERKGVKGPDANSYLIIPSSYGQVVLAGGDMLTKATGSAIGFELHLAA